MIIVRTMLQPVDKGTTASRDIMLESLDYEIVWDSVRSSQRLGRTNSMFYQMVRPSVLQEVSLPMDLKLSGWIKSLAILTNRC